jgi:hypothetical protein
MGGIGAIGYDETSSGQSVILHEGNMSTVGGRQFKRTPYQGTFSEVVSVENLVGDEYRIVERDPIHGGRLTWVNSKTGVVMIEDVI